MASVNIKVKIDTSDVDALQQAVEDALHSYWLQTMVDEEGDACLLLDALSPGPTIREGREELMLLAEHITEEILKRRGKV